MNDESDSREVGSNAGFGCCLTQLRKSVCDDWDLPEVRQVRRDD